MDDKPFRLLAGFRAALFFFACMGLEKILAHYGIFLIPVLGLPFSFMALFFPLWEFLFFLGFLEKKISFFLAPWIFLGALGIYFLPPLAGYWNGLFFVLLIFETPKKGRIFKGILLAVLCLSLWFLPAAGLFFLISLFPCRFYKNLLFSAEKP